MDFDKVTFTIINRHKSDIREAAILGHNIHLMQKNYGSDEDIKILVKNEEVNYLDMLSAMTEKTTEQITLKSDNPKQVTQILKVHRKDMNGQEMTMPIIPQSYISADVNTDKKIIIPHKIKVDAYMFFKIKIFPRTRLDFILHFKDSLNVSRSENPYIGAPVGAILGAGRTIGRRSGMQASSPFGQEYPSRPYDG